MLLDSRLFLREPSLRTFFAPAPGSMASLSIERVTSLRGLLALESDWRELEAELPEVPFVSFDWLYPWWRLLRAEQLSVRDELFVCVLRDPDGKLRAVAPLMRTLRPGRGPLCLRQLQFFGADPNITELRTLVARTSDLPEVIPALLEYLRANKQEWDFMHFAGVPASLAGALDLEQPGAGYWMRDIPNYILTLKPTWDEFKAGLSRNIKESLRKCYNAPKRDGVTFTLSVVREPHEVKAAITTFLRLHGERAELDNTISHPNVFATEGGREFLEEACTRFATHNRLRIFQLKHGDAVVATRIGFVCGSTLYLYYSGYDPNYAKYSVMTRAVAQAIEWAIQQGFANVNLSMGNDVSKLRWGPSESVYREAHLISPSLRGTITHESFAWATQRLGRGTRHPLAALLARRL
jgi:CelD/BcsL family acetyltransferase involved in cellulose biosynthesis